MAELRLTWTHKHSLSAGEAGSWTGCQSVWFNSVKSLFVTHCVTALGSSFDLNLTIYLALFWWPTSGQQGRLNNWMTPNSEETKCTSAKGYTQVLLFKAYFSMVYSHRRTKHRWQDMYVLAKSFFNCYSFFLPSPQNKYLLNSSLCKFLESIWILCRNWNAVWLTCTFPDLPLWNWGVFLARTLLVPRLCSTSQLTSFMHSVRASFKYLVLHSRIFRFD